MLGAFMRSYFSPKVHIEENISGTLGFKYMIYLSFNCLLCCSLPTFVASEKTLFHSTNSMYSGAKNSCFRRPQIQKISLQEIQNFIAILRKLPHHSLEAINVQIIRTMFKQQFDQVFADL